MLLLLFLDCLRGVLPEILLHKGAHTHNNSSNCKGHYETVLQQAVSSTNTYLSPHYRIKRTLLLSTYNPRTIHCLISLSMQGFKTTQN